MAVKFTPANATMLELLEGGVPVQQGQAILKEVMSNSLITQLGKYVEMNSPEMEFDVFEGGVNAYWVGEGERIKTSTSTWAKKKMVTRKLGVILPVSREYLNYKQANFFEFMKPYLAEAIYKKIDIATISNIDNPFDQSIDTAATIIEDDITTANYEAMIAALNDLGHEPNAFISKVSNTTALRNLVRQDENGVFSKPYDHASRELDGVPVFNINKDLADFNKGTIYTGDFNQVLYGIPYNMNYMISQEATLTTIVDEEKNPLNLFEREMSALRVTMDFSFFILNETAFGGIKAAKVGG